MNMPCISLFVWTAVSGWCGFIVNGIIHYFRPKLNDELSSYPLTDSTSILPENLEV